MASETTYQLNDQAHLTVAFTVGGVATDPTTVTASVRKPDGTTTNYTVMAGQIVKDSVGNYHLDITTDLSGRWAYKFAGTGSVVDVEQGVFYVIPDWTTSNPTFYLTADELKSTLAITTSTADVDISAAIIAASRAIDGICRRRFYPDADATQVRYYTPETSDWLEVDDLLTLTSLTTDEDASFGYATAWTQNTDFILEPLNAAADGDPYTNVKVLPTGNHRFLPTFPRSVKVTGKFGWLVVPDEVVQATTILAARLFKIAREAPLGIISWEGGAVYIGRSDPGIMGLIGPLIRHRISIG